MNNSASLSYRAPVEEYERQATALFDELKSGGEPAAWRFKWLHPRFRARGVDDVRAATLNLADARLVVALEHSFDDWAALAEFSESVGRDRAVARFEAAVEAVIAGDLETLRSLLRDNPELVRARSTRRHRATLLHYVGANGVENCRQKTPPNAVAIARALLDAGAEVDALADLYDAKCTTLSMLVSSCHPAEAGLQGALAETLVDYGAATVGPGSRWQSAITTALAFGYLDTAQALARRAAPADDFATAAGLGRLADVVRLLPSADVESRHVALALAAQHGHVEIVGTLLNAGEDPNRYNPEGFHAHSTPLHQAALAGHANVVRLLVDRGAQLNIRDTIYQGTPLGWAIHGNRAEIAEYLRAKGPALPP
jgi:ankyrin repeat protein